MRITKVRMENFQSYPSLEFDYSNLGLALIAGPMGAGKSTLLDAPYWTLYGQTSKESAADDVRAWFAADELTTGNTLVVLADGSVLEVTRIRGKRSAQNDLYFFQHVQGQHGSSEPTRGKDAADTQRMIVEKLGVDAELYAAASYMTQFSRADQFFLAKAKDRRDTLERIADQSFAISLGEKASEARKVAKKERDAAQDGLTRVEGKLEAVRAQMIDLAERLIAWDDDRSERLVECFDKQEAATVEIAGRIKLLEGEGLTWDAEKTVRVSLAQKMKGDWELQRLSRLAEARDEVTTWEGNRSARAMKIADQLGLLDRQIVEPSEFETRKAQAKQQLKVVEAAAADLTTKSGELIGVKGQIRNLQKEYATLNSLEGTCPACLGPADNEHGQARKAAIESELISILDQHDALEEAVNNLTDATAPRAKMYEEFQSLGRKEAENQALINRARDLKAQAEVIRLEANPFTAQIARVGAEINPYLNAADHAAREINPIIAKLEQVRALVNPFTAQIEAIRAEDNPYSGQGYDAELKANALQEEAAKATAQVEAYDHEIASLTWLYDKSFVLRGQLLSASVKAIEDRTNEIMEKFFDADLRVSFSLPDSDKLEVLITKNGYPCPFKQLSGGQRTLLCRAFGLAYMKAAENTAGVKMDVLALDEALSGLDPEMKVKAFPLFQTLAETYSTVLLIDHHQELQQMFPTRFQVSIAADRSSIQQVLVD